MLMKILMQLYYHDGLMHEMSLYPNKLCVFI